MMLKDLGLAQAASDGANAHTHLGKMAQRHYQSLSDLGYGDRDFSLPFDLLSKDDPYGP